MTERAEDQPLCGRQSGAEEPARTGGQREETADAAAVGGRSERACYLYWRLTGGL